MFPQVVETETFIKESEGRIAKLQAELAEWEKMIPYDQMTMEEMVEAFPNMVSFHKLQHCLDLVRLSLHQYKSVFSAVIAMSNY